MSDDERIEVNDMAPMETGSSERELYSVLEVARRLGISRAEVAREIARRRLASVKLGRRRLVSRAQLAAYVERLERSVGA